MSKILVIAEKPSMGKDIARIIEPNGTINQGHIVGTKYIITWCYGHLVGLSSPRRYSDNPWDPKNLPIIPESFHYEKPDDPGKQKQISIIQKLAKEATSLINACDAGREGEAIFRYLICEVLKINKPIQRLWINSLTDDAIKSGFQKLKPSHEYDSLYNSAVCRDQTDWIIGMGVGTPALSHIIRTANPNIKYISVGRVFTPTFAMVCKRYLEHIQFQQQTYYKIEINVGFPALSINDYVKKEEAQQKMQLLDSAQITEITKENITEAAPLFYDLTSLQKAANESHGLSAEQTLEAAQKLYEKKFITYPRTDSRYINEDMKNDVINLLNQHKNQLTQEQESYITALKNINKRVINDNKVTDHHAIIITNNKPTNITGDELIIYKIVLKQFFAALSENASKEKTTITLNSSNEEFKTISTNITYAGHRVFNKTQSEEEKAIKLPQNIAKGNILYIQSKQLLQKETQPKPIHTESTLLSAMENCGREVEDEQIKEALKGSGIGTPATRASMIEKLFQQNLVTRQGKKLVPTKHGLYIYDIIKDNKIASAELTGEYEMRLTQIRANKLSTHEYMQLVKQYAKQLTQEILQTKTEQLNIEGQLQCPICKTGQMLSRPKSVNCSNWNADNDNKCNFTIWRTMANKKLTDNQINTLITKGKTPIIKAFKSKSGKPFDAALVIKEGQIQFQFNK
jgi:DNA topoisomerase-3